MGSDPISGQYASDIMKFTCGLPRNFFFAACFSSSTCEPCKRKSSSSQRVASTGYEQHWHPHARKMLGTLDARLPGRVQRESEEREPPDLR